MAGQIATHDSAVFTAPQSKREDKLEGSDITILLAADESIWINNESVLNKNDLSLYLQTHEITSESRVALKVDAHLKASMLDPLIATLQSLGIQRLKLVTTDAL